MKNNFILVTKEPCWGDRLDTAVCFYGGIMKKIKFLIYIIMVCLCLSGCAKEISYTGKAEIEKARSLHTGLESARITMTDNISGEVIQEIEYLFVGEVMTYMYTGRDGETTYHEYNNGTELNFITLPEQTEWSFFSKGDENYYSYSKASRHYFADGEQLFSVYPTAISTVTAVDENEGGKHYSYTYSTAALKDYEAFKGMDDITSFNMSYVLDSDGYCTEFTNMYTMDGVDYSYTVEISRMNEIEKVERVSLDK